MLVSIMGCVKSVELCVPMKTVRLWADNLGMSVYDFLEYAYETTHWLPEDMQAMYQEMMYDKSQLDRCVGEPSVEELARDEYLHQVSFDHVSPAHLQEYYDTDAEYNSDHYADYAEFTGANAEID